jgi:hypothetical protein
MDIIKKEEIYVSNYVLTLTMRGIDRTITPSVVEVVSYRRYGS